MRGEGVSEHTLLQRRPLIVMRLEQGMVSSMCSLRLLKGQSPWSGQVGCLVIIKRSYVSDL
jgi:hypothetical protein